MVARITVDQLDPKSPLFATVASGGLHRSEVYDLVSRLACAAGFRQWGALSMHGLRYTFNAVAKQPAHPWSGASTRTHD